MSSLQPSTHFTKPTTTFWQEILPSNSITSSSFRQPYQYSYPATLPDSRILRLPIRQLPDDPNEAVASLIINQASISVVEEFRIEFGSYCCQAAGERYIPLGYSVKFWYTSALSTSTSSITSPSGSKKLYLDPNLLPLVKGKKVLVIDDAVSSGKTLKATWDFLEGENVACEVLGVGVVMKQGDRWKEAVGEERSAKVRWVFESPLLKAVEDGWEIRD